MWGGDSSLARSWLGEREKERWGKRENILASTVGGLVKSNQGLSSEFSSLKRVITLMNCRSLSKSSLISISIKITPDSFFQCSGSVVQPLVNSQ